MTLWHKNFAYLLLPVGTFPHPYLQPQKTCAQPQAFADTKFAPGQVWSYKTRPEEERSTITVLRVERTPKLGTIIHVRINDVHFHKCKSEDGLTQIEHAPFAKAALEASVFAQVGSVSELPDYNAGYRDWLSHCGGIYTIPVDKVVDVDDTTFSAGLGCS